MAWHRMLGDGNRRGGEKIARSIAARNFKSRHHHENHCLKSKPLAFIFEDEAVLAACAAFSSTICCCPWRRPLAVEITA